MAKPKIVNPWSECQWEAADASAIQALFRGDASPDQQQRAINFIVSDVAAVPYLAFDATSERNTTFALGKQAVGHKIIQLSRLNLNQFVKSDKQPK